MNTVTGVLHVIKPNNMAAKPNNMIYGPLAPAFAIIEATLDEEAC
jgi:hypothetical protein